MRTTEKRSERRGLLGMARGVLRKVYDDKKQQLVDVDVLADEKKRKREHWLPYGFTAVPHAGAEALTAFLQGSRAHPVIVAIADRRYRLTELASGEVAIHDDQGQKVHFKRDRTIVVSSKPVEIESEEVVRLKAPKIVLEADEVHLGGEGGPRVHRIGDVDSDDDTAVSGATKVYAV